MEVILLEDVKSVGKKGQIVKVNDSYARNVLIAKKLGLEATSKNMNDLKLQNANQAKIEKEKLKEMSVTLAIKSGEGGKTFGSISTKEIAEAIKAQLGLDLDKKKMVLDEPIRTLGNHIIQVKLHKEVTGSLTVKVKEK